MIKQEHKNLVSVKRACELCKVLRSGYYEWLRRPAKKGADVLGQKIKRIFQKSRKTYGTRRIKKQLYVQNPNTACVMDITYLATSEGWIYLAIILDLYSRMVVGWSIGKRMTKELVIDLLMHLRPLLRGVIPLLGLFATRIAGVNTAEARFPM